MNSKVAAKSLPNVFAYAWVILAVVYFAGVAAPFNQFKVPPIMPVLLDRFNIDLAQAGLLMSMFAMIGLVLALPAGIILQRLGSKITGLIALACLAAGSALGALANGFGLLMASRVIEGIGMGLIGVVAPATIAMWFPPEKQGAPMGIWATWVPVGTVVMYALAPALTDAFGWQSVWWLGAGFALLMMVLYALLVRRPPTAIPLSPDEAAASKGDEGLNLRQALANRDIWLLALEFACFNMALISLNSYYPTFLNEVRAFPLGQAAVVASLGSFVVLGSSPLAGWLSDRLGSRRLVFGLPFLGLAGLLLFPFTVTGGWIYAVMIVQGILCGGVPTATFAAAPEVMRKPQLAGLGLSVVLIGQNLGQLIGPALFGLVVKNAGWAAAGYLMVPVCLIGFVAAWRVRVR